MSLFNQFNLEQHGGRMSDFQNAMNNADLVNKNGSIYSAPGNKPSIVLSQTNVNAGATKDGKLMENITNYNINALTENIARNSAWGMRTSAAPVTPVGNQLHSEKLSYMFADGNVGRIPSQATTWWLSMSVSQQSSLTQSMSNAHSMNNNSNYGSFTMDAERLSQQAFLWQQSQANRQTWMAIDVQE